MSRALISLSNFASRLRRKRVRPEEVLLLFASCLQKSDCTCNVRESLEHCARCGGCPVGPMLDLADELGVRAFIATGGRRAAEMARSQEIKAVVAVACCKELAEGLRATFPKPTLLLELDAPHGPCKDTQIDVSAVREAIMYFIRS